MIIILVGLKKYILLRKQHREIRDDFVKFQGNRRQNVEAIARHDVRGLAGKAHGKTPFSWPWSSAEQRGAIASELSPTTRTSCAVIYRPYLRPANCLFKHNKTAVPPFNLRRALFRVRTPFRFPLVPPSALSFLLRTLLPSTFRLFSSPLYAICSILTGLCFFPVIPFPAHDRVAFDQSMIPRYYIQLHVREILRKSTGCILHGVIRSVVIQPRDSSLGYRGVRSIASPHKVLQRAESKVVKSFVKVVYNFYKQEGL